MKTILNKITAFTLLLALIALALASCAKVDPVGTATVVVTEDGKNFKEYSVPLSKVTGKEGAISVLEYLRAEGELDFEATDSGYGKYLTKVGEVEENGAEGKYVGIYTSVEADFDVSEYKTELEYKGTKLVSSGVGISSMSVPDGAIIYITYIVYG